MSPSSMTPVAAPGGGAPWRGHVLAGLICLLATFALHGSALDGYWRWDDGPHLNFALQYDAWEYFFIPEITRTFVDFHVTPWNPYFYDLNLPLFGLEPKGYYLHLLLLMWLGAVLFYLLLREWLPWPAALFGALVLLAGKPTVHIVQGLMHAHYAAGLAFVLLGLLGWVRALKGGHPAWLWLAAFAYLLSTTCKEVFVPLVVLLPFIPAGRFRDRMRRLWPFVVVAAFYTLWRYLVLGHLLGGYRPGGEGFDVTATLRQFLAMPGLLSGDKPSGLAILGLAGLLFALAAWKRRLDWRLLVALAAVTLLPLVPLTIFPGVHAPDRYLFLPWVAVAAGLAALLPGVFTGRPATVVGVLLLALLSVEHNREEHRLGSVNRLMETLYRFAATADAGRQGIFIANDGYGCLTQELTGIRNAMRRFRPGTVDGPLAVMTDTPANLLGHPGETLRGRQFFEYRDGAMRPVDILAAMRPTCVKLDRSGERRMQVAIRHDGDRLHWVFGPYAGDYDVVIGGLGTARLTRVGSYPWRADRRLVITVCSMDEARGAMCAPRLEFDPRAGSLRWEGPPVTAGTLPAACEAAAEPQPGAAGGS